MALVLWYNRAVLKRTLRNLAIFAITVGLLVFVFRRSDLGNVWTLIRSTNPLWFVGGLATNTLALFLRTERWRILLAPLDPPPYYPTFFSVSAGYMSSSVLPVRAGDVVRATLIHRKTGARVASALATVVAERVLDLLSILFLALLFVALSVGEAGLEGSRLVFLRSVGVISGSMFAGMTFFLLGILFVTSKVRSMHEGLGRLLPARFHDAWMHFFDTFVASFRIARHRGPFAKILVLTFLTWLCLTSEFWFVIQSLGHDLPFRSCFLMTGVTVVGLMIPTPGGVGGFHAAVQVALVTFYGLDIDSSVAIAVVFHVVGTAPVVVIGTVLLLWEGLTFRQLSEIGDTDDQ